MDRKTFEDEERTNTLSRLGSLNLANSKIRRASLSRPPARRILNTRKKSCGKKNPFPPAKIALLRFVRISLRYTLRILGRRGFHWLRIFDKVGSSGAIKMLTKKNSKHRLEFFYSRTNVRTGAAATCSWKYELKSLWVRIDICFINTSPLSGLRS